MSWQRSETTLLNSATGSCSTIVRRMMALCACVLAVSFSQASAADPNAVGFVFKINGAWVHKGNSDRPIKGGDHLPSEAMIHPLKEGNENSLVMCFYDGSMKTYDKAGKLPKRAKESTANQIWLGVFGHYRGGVVQAASRGQEMLSDGLAKLNDSKLDLTSLTQGVPDGQWTFRLKPFNADGKPDTSKINESVSFSLKCSERAEAIATVDGLKPGLYELQLINPRTKRPLESPVVVLVCSEDQYAKRLAKFQEAVTLTKSWTDDDSEEIATPFLRLYLEELATSEK